MSGWQDDRMTSHSQTMVESNRIPSSRYKWEYGEVTRR
jgi:hypothetical protein